MSLRYRILIAMFLVSAVGAVIWSARHYHSLYRQEQARADAAEQSQKKSDLITQNVLAATSLMNDISRATNDAKQDTAKAGEQQIVYIRQAVKGDGCSNQFVPAAAANSLRNYANRIRGGAVGADKR